MEISQYLRHWWEFLVYIKNPKANDEAVYTFVGGIMDPNKLNEDPIEDFKDTSSKKVNEDLAAKKKSEEFGNLRFSKQAKVENPSGDIITFMKENTKDTIAYVLLIAGIMMMFFDNVAIYGGLIVGVIFGLYFAKELAYLVTNATNLIEQEGTPKSLMFGALLLIFLIKAPFVFIGAALVAVLKAFFADDISKNVS